MSYLGNQRRLSTDLPRAAILVLSLLCFVGCGGSTVSKEQVSEKINMISEKLVLIETQASATDQEALDLVENSRSKLRKVQDLIIQDEFTRAHEALLTIERELDRFQRANSNSRTLVDFKDFGSVKVRLGDGAFERITPHVDLSKLRGIETGIRSGIELNPNSSLKIFVQASSEVIVHQYSTSGQNYDLELVKGELYISKGTDQNVVLRLGQFRATLNAVSSAELNIIPVSRKMYFSLHKGTAAWTEGDENGTLVKYQAMKWVDGRRNQVPIPVAPGLDSPNNNESVATGTTGKATISFRWHTEVFIPEFQLQVSEHPQFFTRKADEIGVRSGGAEIELPTGKYYWRVRGLGEDNVPGPFSRVRMLSVTRQSSRTGDIADSGRPKANVPGPKVRDLKVEIIGGMAIISGKTSDNVGVNVNGVAAVMMGEGLFRAVVNFEKAGKHQLRIIATDKATTGETIVERTVQIKF
ncbi:hypothetical protein SCOR_10945 [Sulfidibacter corallicola]|uniref:FecR protein domain-containing protein n=1 Tax=Sulfidibacter corallicola TaxID=2818388 RepID=A0A8A4TF26_SULCO|nr:hypothetical protein [Sulfidibacter corallicola]QTD48147.1 hypothetical protein J3U87_21385 [Sulfidibacter corallicola]